MLIFFNLNLNIFAFIFMYEGLLCCNCFNVMFIHLERKQTSTVCIAVRDKKSTYYKAY